MRTGWNVVVQVVAVVVFALLRFTAPGWMLALLVLTVVGLLALLVPPVLSLVVLRWRVLPRSVAAPFVVAAGTLLLTGLVLPDQADAPIGATPILVLFGIGGAPGWAWALGSLFAFAYLASLLWLAIAMAVEAERRRRQKRVSEGSANPRNAS